MSCLLCCAARAGPVDRKDRPVSHTHTARQPTTTTHQAKTVALDADKKKPERTIWRLRPLLLYSPTSQTSPRSRKGEDSRVSAAVWPGRYNDESEELGSTPSLKDERQKKKP